LLIEKNINHKIHYSSH